MRKGLYVLRYQVMFLFIIMCCGCMLQREPPLSDRHRSMSLVEQGRAHLRAREFEKAGASFAVANDVYPTPESLDGLGCVAMMTGDFERAERLLWRAHELDENYTDAVANLALLYEARGDLQRSRKLFEWAIHADPKNFRARNNYAAFLYEHGSSIEMNSKVRNELLKAHALAEHPVIGDNLKSVNEVPWLEKR